MVLFFEQELFHYRTPIFTALQEGLNKDLSFRAARPPASADHITADEAELPFACMELKTLWLAGAKLYVEAWLAAFRRFGLPEVVIVQQAIRDLTLLPLLWYCWHKPIPLWCGDRDVVAAALLSPGRTCMIDSIWPSFSWLMRISVMRREFMRHWCNT